MTPPKVDHHVPLPALPDVEDVPRNSVVDVEIMAATLLATVQKWAPRAVAAGDFRGAGELRRRLSPVVMQIYRYNISRSAVLDAQQALRTADRVAGITVRAGQQAGLIRSHGQSKGTRLSVGEILGGNDRSGIYHLAGVTDAEFTAGIARARAAGGLSMESLVGHLGIPLNPTQQAQRDRIAELAARGSTSRQIAAEMQVRPGRVTELAKRYGLTIHGDVMSRNTHVLNPTRIITEIIPIIDGAGSAAEQLDAADITAIPPEQAREWARQLRRVLTPVIRLQRLLADHGKEV